MSLQDELQDALVSLDLTYGKVVGTDVRVSIHPPFQIVKIANFKFQDGLPKIGTCEELLVTAGYEFTKKFPSLHVYFLSGNDPKYFSDKVRSNHSYLCVSEQSLFPGRSLDSGNGLERLRSANAFVVDPSFGIVVPIENSGYLAKSICEYTPYLPLSSDVLLSIGKRRIPIGMQGDSVVMMYSQGDKNDPFDILFEFGSIMNPSLRSERFAMLNQNMLSVVDALNAKEVVVSYDRPYRPKFFLGSLLREEGV